MSTSTTVRGRVRPTRGRCGTRSSRLVDGYVAAGVGTWFAGGSPNLSAHVYLPDRRSGPRSTASATTGSSSPGRRTTSRLTRGLTRRARSSLALEQHAVPSDNIANRIVIDPSQLGPNTAFGPTATHLATAEPNEPAHAGSPAARSNWAELLPFTQSGNVELTYSTFTQASGVPYYSVDRHDNDGTLRLAVYTGDPSSFATLTPVPVTGSGPYTVHVDPAKSYFLAWDAAGLATSYFTFGASFTPDQTNQTGSVHADITLEGGLAIGERACFELDGPGAPTSPKCVSSSPSSIDFQNVPVGSYSVAVYYQSTVGSTAGRAAPGALRGSCSGTSRCEPTGRRSECLRHRSDAEVARHRADGDIHPRSRVLLRPAARLSVDCATRLGM